MIKQKSRYPLFLSSVVMMSVAVSAKAENSLKGKWTMTSMACSSGAPYKGFEQGKGFTGKVDGSISFEGSEAKSEFEVFLKYDRANDGNVTKQLEEALKMAQEAPEGPDKQKWVDELSKTLATMKNYEAGVSCSLKETTPYAFDGTILKLGKPTSNTSSCPAFEPLAAGQGEEVESRLEITGDVMKMTVAATEEQENGPCPRGDHMVTTLQRSAADSSAR